MKPTLTLYVSLKGLTRAIQSNKDVFIGCFEKPQGNLGIYLQMDFPLLAVTITEDVPYGEFSIVSFRERTASPFNGGGTLKPEIKLIPLPERKNIAHPPIEPAPHVATI